jgi:hypothetical protein
VVKPYYSEAPELHSNAQDRERLTIGKPLKFNGGMVKLESNGITLTQEAQCIKLSPFSRQMLKHQAP